MVLSSPTEAILGKEAVRNILNGRQLNPVTASTVKQFHDYAEFRQPELIYRPVWSSVRGGGGVLWPFPEPG